MAYQLPPPPNVQALDSSSFKVPPLDRSLLEIYDWHYEHSKDHTLFVYADENGVAKEIKWPEAVRAIHVAGRIVRSNVGTKGDGTREGTPLVAILAASDTITFFTTIVGCMRAGYGVFPISTRNSPSAIAHLLEKTQAIHLIIGREDALITLAQTSLQLLQQETGRDIQTSVMPLFEEVYLPPSKHVEMLEEFHPKGDALAVILHSSGSTAYPKPVYRSHYQFLQLSIVPFFGEVDLCGVKLACHGLPMYHGLALMQVGWTATAGLTMATFRPQQPAVLPTPEAVIKGAIDTTSDILFCVPAFAEYWSRFPAYVDYLKTTRGLLYGGGPLNKKIGDSFVEKGINIYNLYGCTEIGIATPIIPKSMGYDWEYFYLSPQSKGYFVPNGDGYAELVLLTSKYQQPCVFNGTYEGDDAYFTGDLFLRHPTNPNMWRVYGRVDDQIMHNTGEKTNPGPLESILMEDPHVASVVMFGRGKFNPGVLVAPKPQFKVDPTNETELAQFRNLIWPTVEKMNEYAPQHSRLFKEMILIELSTKPFTYTAKATPRRHAIINEYEAEIEALYKVVDDSSQFEVPCPEVWDTPSTTEFVHALISRVMGKEVEDSANVFEQGCDSLQATWLRNALFRTIRESSKQDIRQIPQMIVYQCPTITALANYVVSFVAGSQTAAPSPTIVADLQSMVVKYSRNFGAHTPPSPPLQSSQPVVMITGTTGGMGASLLSLFLEEEEVPRVYAVNRPSQSGLSSEERHKNIFVKQGLDYDALLAGVKDGRVVFLESMIGDSSLDLPQAQLQELRQTVTHIVHNAWPVNFNMHLMNFETSIRSVRALVDFALCSDLSSPPTILYTSSVGIHIGNPGPYTETLSDPVGALGMGYTQSKWCAEQILAHASAATPVKTSIVRIGQVCGGRTGYWNTAEWFPTLVKSSIKLGALPMMSKPVTWIPMDLSVKVLRDLTFSNIPSGQATIYHLAHARPIQWSTLLDYLGLVLPLPKIPYSEWLSRLQAEQPAAAADNSHSLQNIPALKILPFFSGVGEAAFKDPYKEAMGLPTVSIDNAVKASRTLGDKNLRQLGKEDVDRWVGYWQEQGFMASLPKQNL